MNINSSTTATIITPDFSQLESFEKDSLNNALSQMIEKTKANNYNTFLIPSTGISSCRSQQIINDSNLKFIWCIVYYYQKMLWEKYEDIGALELIKNADDVIELEYEETDHYFTIYRWFIDNSGYIIFIWDGSYPSIISSLIGYTQVIGKNGLIYNCKKDKIFKLLTPDMIPLMLQDQFYDPDF